MKPQPPTPPKKFSELYTPFPSKELGIMCGYVAFREGEECDWTILNKFVVVGWGGGFN